MIKSIRNTIRTLLMRSQHYTGTDNVYVAKNGFWTSLPYLANTLLGLTQVLVFANLLPKETYGTYKYILSIAGSFGFLTLTGMNVAVTQITARGIDSILEYSVHLQLKFNLLYTVAASIISIYYWYHANYTLALGLVIIGITFPLSAALTTYGAYLGGKKEFRRVSQYAIISTIFSSSAIILATVLTQNIIWIVLAYGLGGLLPIVYFYFRVRKTINAPAPTAAEKQELTAYAGHLSFLNILSTVRQYVDKIILFHFTGAIELAVYSLAQAMPDRVEGYFKSWNMLLLPKLSERTIERVAPVFYTRVLQGMFIGSLIALGYWIAAPFAFKLFLPRYLESIEYSRVIMLSFIFTMPGAYVANVFKSQKMLKVIYISSTFGNLSLIALYAILGPLFGIWGLAWAHVIGHGLGTITNSILWQWHLNRHRPTGV